MEEEHLLTKASIPYRDQDLNLCAEDIIRKRLDEQLLSIYYPQRNGRKVGMTKSAFRVRFKYIFIKIC